jgi:hypothetical protein
MQTQLVPTLVRLAAGSQVRQLMGSGPEHAKQVESHAAQREALLS